MFRSSRTKIFQDSVQGIIEVEPIILRFIDTPEFQRLRRLHQLGIVNYVYPDCTHTRFEHSLGTYHLAKRLVDAIQADPECASVRLSIGERMSVLIAALCHDLGHGPLSHTWELFLKQGGSDYNKFKHENMSCLITERIVAKDEPLRDLLKDSGVDLELVYALIRGHPTPELVERLREKTFIFEIVSNSLNGNDVDKWDYIMRDSLHAGLGQGSGVIEVERMLRFYRPAYHASGDAWHMSFRSSEASNVLRIFSQRTRLYHSVYSHKTTLALGAMFVDILNALDSILQLRDLSLRACAGDDHAMEAFLRLDEHLLWAMASSQYLLPPETSPTIKANLRQLCQRIEFRQLYSFVGKFLLAEIKTVINEHDSLSANDNRSDLSKLLDNACEAEDKPEDVIKVEKLGTEAQILTEILRKLPPRSSVRSVDELRLVVTTHSSNSTDGESTFFAYKTLPNAFSITRPLTKIYCCSLLWTGPLQKGSATRLLRGPTPAPPCLVEALNSWLGEKRAAQTTRVSDPLFVPEHDLRRTLVAFRPIKQP
uniref:Metal dependent phosphohydrolase HD region n=1 Tax=Echinococcus granulosus TaxID=6210 RepID=A0A068W8N0_ECHGR|nr:Metal dependent phosphohydrolase HD region [Echinococcus granulosus]